MELSENELRLIATALADYAETYDKWARKYAGPRLTDGAEKIDALRNKIADEIVSAEEGK